MTEGNVSRDVKPTVISGQTGHVGYLSFSVCSRVSTLTMQCCSNAAPAGTIVSFFLDLFLL